MRACSQAGCRQRLAWRAAGQRRARHRRGHDPILAPEVPTAVCVLLRLGFPCQDFLLADQGRARLAVDSLGSLGVRARSGPLREVLRGSGDPHHGRKRKGDARRRPADHHTHALGVPPVSICAPLFRRVRRPRLWWLNWTVAASDGLFIVVGRDLGDGSKVYKVVDPASRGKPDEWLAAKSSSPGEIEQRPLPTFLRWVPRMKPLGCPNGLVECSAED